MTPNAWNFDFWFIFIEHQDKLSQVLKNCSLTESVITRSQHSCSTRNLHKRTLICNVGAPGSGGSICTAAVQCTAECTVGPWPGLSYKGAGSIKSNILQSTYTFSLSLTHSAKWLVAGDTWSLGKGEALCEGGDALLWEQRHKWCNDLLVCICIAGQGRTGSGASWLVMSCTTDGMSHVYWLSSYCHLVLHFISYLICRNSN